ncbi:transglycosylase domain-containing protein [Glycomyces paridis]|uniref:Uncharacterized protein n=1 Tax=Glycomyces paridis TaxID=2126555 RepID=A0A4S8PEE7_9ACTN|nr:transglycosylase domain-containing protein [Glycomyces paridis]THV26724.1 hypothetical protein E9998_17175 [Glycomyces paridis]
MSDYGYRPAPPPEDGRAQGRGAGQQGGRAYGNAQNGSNDPDYGWGGGRQGGQQGGAHGSSPQPNRSSYGSAPQPNRSPYGTPASGSAAVGRGSAPAGRGSASAGRGSASVGRGSASIGGPASGAASVGGPGRTGRASVGSASVGSASVGSASVGSASVGSASVTGARTGGPGEPPERGGRRRAGKGPGGKGPDGKKRKRIGRKMLAVFVALGVLFVAAVTIAGTIFFQSVPPLSGIAYQGESSAFYLANGKQAGAYGDTLRLQAAEEDIPETVTQALVALEDRKFYEHNGVDYLGTMRALVNNIKGGDTQGASTITQQYAGMVLDAREDISYDRKAKEAATAIKLEDRYEKGEIITAYLNMAYFGRGAYGIEAAAKNYFNVPLEEITYDQAAFIVMQVKSPNGYYDPFYDTYDEGASKGRWNYTMDALVETGKLSQSERDGYEYPEPITDFIASGSWGGNTDVGFIINEQDGYVFDELYERYGLTRDMLKGNNEDHENDPLYDGGYQITLTIDPEIQASLKTTGSRGEIKVDTNEDGEYLDADGDVVTDISDAKKILTDEGYVQFTNSNDKAALANYEEYMMTAMVAIEPETGEILGYYGGDNGFGVDKAGAESPHPPSSTFKMVTAALALSEGDSTDSWFNADSPRGFDTLKLDDTEQCIGGADYPDCTLRNGTQGQKNLEMTLTDAVRKSKNTPMYGIAEQYGADAILELAEQMGLTMMNQGRTLQDEEDKDHDVSINYVLNDDGTYTQHGTAVDADGESVVDANGNWDVNADIKVDDNCEPIINLDGRFIQAEEATPCKIGEGGKTDPFYYHLAFGQYPTSVRDMASIYATIANDGVYNESHFVAKVTDNKGNVIEPKDDTLTLNERVLDEGVARNLQWIGSEIAGETEATELDRDYFGKTGTWEAGGFEADCRNDPDTTDVGSQCEEYSDRYAAHAWYVGAIPQLSIAAWVGNVTSESDPIANDQGNKEAVYGSNTAQPVWYKAMTLILEAKDGDEAWDEQTWLGKVDNMGNKTYWDIENAGGPNEGGEFCAANADNELCKGQANQEAQEECVEDGGTWDGETCTPADDTDDPPTGDPTDEPTDGETGEECGDWFQEPCETDEPTDPETDGPTEGATTEGPDRQDP